jgi:hypothetical protein
MPAITRAVAEPSPAQYTPLPPHPVSKEGEAYLATLTAEQLELHELAVKMLGSSYFVERTHGFRKWVAASAAAPKQKT